MLLVIPAGTDQSSGRTSDQWRAWEKLCARVRGQSRRALTPRPMKLELVEKIVEDPRRCRRMPTPDETHASSRACVTSTHRRRCSRTRNCP